MYRMPRAYDETPGKSSPQTCQRRPLGNNLDPNDALPSQIIVTLHAGDRALFRRLRAKSLAEFSQYDLWMVQDILWDLLRYAGARP